MFNFLFFAAFHKAFKHPPECEKYDCQYHLEMDEESTGIVTFKVMFKGSNFIQIGMNDVPNEVLFRLFLKITINLVKNSFLER